MAVSDDDIRTAILGQCEEVRSVAPREIATSLADADTDWRIYLPRIRAIATALSIEGLLVFIRKKKVVSPEGLRGVYRLAKPENYQDSEI